MTRRRRVLREQWSRCADAEKSSGKAADESRRN
jgi:hypothetical protein